VCSSDLGNTYFPQGRIIDALTYVLKNQPNSVLERDPVTQAVYEKELEETRRAGNFDLDYHADWIDYERAGVTDEASLIEKMRSVLVDVELEEDIRGFGLKGTLDPAKNGELCDQLIIARKRFRSRLDDLGFDGFVEPFEPDSYNTQATVAENLLFGTAIDPTFEPDKLPSNTMIRQLLAESGLENELFNMGKEVAATTVELFGDLAPDNPFFDQLNYMEAEDIPEYRAALLRIGDSDYSDISDEDRLLIMKLPFSYTEDKNRLGLLTESLKENLLIARKKLRTTLESMEISPVSFYETESYNPASSVLDNVLLGRVASTVAEGGERVEEAIKGLLDEMGLTDDIFRIGLQFNIGTGGKRLSENQRQKLHLARSLAKNPDFLIVNQALNTLDTRSQKAIIETVVNRAKVRGGAPMGVIWVPMNATTSVYFDRVLVFDDGELIADGAPEQLKQTEPRYRRLLEA